MYFKRLFRVTRYVFYKETMINPKEILIAFFTSFIGISVMVFLQSEFLGLHESVFLIGSFGASAVLVYGIPNSPLAHPRNVIGGHFISALIGVTVAKLCGSFVGLSASLGVALAIVLMQITKTMHPPGGATALIACIGAPKIMKLGYIYAFTPVLLGATVLVIVAMLVNKNYAALLSFRRYKRRKTYTSKVLRTAVTSQ